MQLKTLTIALLTILCTKGLFAAAIIDSGSMRFSVDGGFGEYRPLSVSWRSSNGGFSLFASASVVAPYCTAGALCSPDEDAIFSILFVNSMVG
ncbi:MAG: hypothetical protein NW208_00515 [Bryobacter sp.]|nr:hypothetical protein [Bryobacter sp.]